MRTTLYLFFAVCLVSPVLADNTGNGVFSYEEYQARLRKKADEDRARIQAEQLAVSG